MDSFIASQIIHGGATTWFDVDVTIESQNLVHLSFRSPATHSRNRGIFKQIVWKWPAALCRWLSIIIILAVATVSSGTACANQAVGFDNRASRLSYLIFYLVGKRPSIPRWKLCRTCSPVLTARAFKNSSYASSTNCFIRVRLGLSRLTTSYHSEQYSTRFLKAFATYSCVFKSRSWRRNSTWCMSHRHSSFLHILAL